MSVPKSRRSQARTEYVYQATVLASLIGAMCSRLPKRWTFTRTRYVLDSANKVMAEAARADAIYATNEREAAERMGHLLAALSEVSVLEKYVDQIALDNPARPCDAGKPKSEQRRCVTDGMLAEAGMQCESVSRLLRAVVKSDRRKWSRKKVRRTSGRSASAGHRAHRSRKVRV